MSDRQKKTATVSARPRATSGDSDDSTARSTKAPSLKSPRTARFAEATAVNSPIEPKKLPFSTRDPPTNHYMAQPQPADVGFGYINKHESVEMPNTDYNDWPSMPKSPLKSPLKSAMKTPGAAPRDFRALRSATFREEEILEKRETHTEKQQIKDLRAKTRVRMAKMLMRGVNFSCSLIVLSMLSSTFAIFEATKTIPSRNDLPPWADDQKVWPQALLLAISCVSLATSLIIFYAYYKGGHRKAQKASVYYNVVAIGIFLFSIIMWGAGAAVLQTAKNNSDNKDMWGWSCADNERHQLFENEVSYDLICRLQNWSLLCCIIEVVVETITIAVYGVVFYRIYSKRVLRKSMANRDRARSDVYLAQLRAESIAPTTPGYPGYGPEDAEAGYFATDDVEAGNVQYVDPVAQKAQPKPFQLQAPPMKGATPKMAQVGFTPVTSTMGERSHTPPEEDQRSPLMAEQPREQIREHFDAAPGEQVYDSVPIPGAYEPQMSPTGVPQHMAFPTSPTGVPQHMGFSHQ